MSSGGGKDSNGGKGSTVANSGGKGQAGNDSGGLKPDSGNNSGGGTDTTTTTTTPTTTDTTTTTTPTTTDTTTTTPTTTTKGTKVDASQRPFFTSYMKKRHNIFLADTTAATRAKRDTTSAAADTTTDADAIKTFHAYTVFDSKGDNEIKRLAEKYFYENVMYHVDQDILDLFEITKPTLSQERLDIFKNPKDIAWYKGFAKVYMANMVATSDADVGAKIDKNLLQHLLSTTCKGKIYTYQTMLLFTYVYEQKYPQLNWYLKAPKKWTKLYKQYLLSNDFVKQWIKDHVADTPGGDISDLKDIQDIKAKLDILDPTCKASNAVISKLTTAGMFFYMQSKFNENDNIKDIFKMVIEQIFTAITNKNNGDFATMVRDLLNSAGTSNASILAVQGALVDEQYATFGENALDLNYLDQALSSYVETAGNNLITRLKVKLPTLLFRARFKVFIVSVLRACQVAMIYFALKNWSYLDGYTKTMFVADSFAIFMDVVTFCEAGNAFVTDLFVSLGTKISDAAAPMITATLASSLDKGCKFLFTASAAEFMLKRFTPALLLISAAKSVVDCIADLKKGNIGAFFVDAISFGVAFGSAVLILAGISWSGPLALAAGVVLTVLAGIKYLIFEKTPSATYYDKYMDAQFKKPT